MDTKETAPVSDISENVTKETHPKVLDALLECEEYFDDRADCDCDQDGFIPNKEMRLLHLVKEALAAVGAS